MIPITREEREWFLRNIALGLIQYANVTEDLDSIEDLLRNPPRLYDNDFCVLDVDSSQIDAVFLRGIDQSGFIAIGTELEPDERNHLLARELLSAVVTSEHGRSMGLHDFLMPYLEVSSQYFAQYLTAYFHLMRAGIGGDGDLRDFDRKLFSPTSVASLPKYLGELEVFFRARFGRYFARSEARQQAANYLQALLIQGRRRTGRQMAMDMGDIRPQAMQRLLYGANWDEEAVRDEMQCFIIDNSGDEEGIAVIGEISFLKRGSKSVGVQRHYSKSTGKMENCQIGVFLAYTASNRCTFLDRRLFLPEEWAMDMSRRAEVKVPEEIKYCSKSDLALEMLQHAWVKGVLIRWVTGDEAYGDNANLRDSISSNGRLYVLGISSDTPVWTDRLPAAQTGTSIQRGRSLIGSRPEYFLGESTPRVIEDVVTGWSDRKWKRLAVEEGADGSRTYDWARMRVFESRGGLLGAEVWLLARRLVSQRSEITYFFSNAPPDTPLRTLACVASARYMFNRIVEKARSEVGLDNYEVRHWHSWHRYITLSMIAYVWLTLGRESHGQDTS